MRPLVILMLIALSPWAFGRAGDWSSGGGILRTAENPWFLSNTSTISYCIVQDPTYFANLPTAVETQIALAFQYWKNHFAAARSPDMDPGQPSLAMATQQFLAQGACSSQSDLVFYLGQLPPGIGNYIADPSSFIGLAVRTDYDEVQLRGRGFVYVSADDGPLAYSGEFLKHGAWHLGQGGLLFKILVHEIGHVFGLPHINENIVMNERFPERVLSPMSADLDLLYPVFEGTRLDGLVDSRCFSRMYSQPFLDFFDIPFALRDRFCYQLKYDTKTGKGAVYYAGSANAPMTLAGTISATAENPTSLGGVNIWLPLGQNVFPGLAPYTSVHGVQALSREVTGVFKVERTGEERQLFFTLTPMNWDHLPQIGGYVNGRLVLDLFR